VSHRLVCRCVIDAKAVCQSLQPPLQQLAHGRQSDLESKPQLRFNAATVHRLIGDAEKRRCQVAAKIHQIGMVQIFCLGYPDGEIVFVGAVSPPKSRHRRGHQNRRRQSHHHTARAAATTAAAIASPIAAIILPRLIVALAVGGWGGPEAKVFETFRLTRTISGPGRSCADDRFAGSRVRIEVAKCVWMTTGSPRCANDGRSVKLRS